MYFLIYSSTVADGIGEVDFQDILTTAFERNEKLDVTGLLVYHEGSFIQLLEGDKENVLQIYDSIKRDERHYNIITLYTGETSKRYFPNWRMAFEAPLEKTFRQVVEFENLNEASDFLDQADLEHQGIRLLRYFYELKRKAS